MRRAPAAATASADHPTDHGITPEPGFSGGSSMGTAIVRGHDLDVLVPTPAIAVLVLDAGVRESARARRRTATRAPAPTALSPSGSRSGRPSQSFLPRLRSWRNTLIVALELVVEDDAPDPPALVAEALLGTLVGAIDLRVVRQLARLPEARIENLTGFVAALGAFVAVGLEEIPAALGQDDGSVVRTERTPANQPFVLEMPKAPPRALSVLTQVVEITLGDHSKRADRRQRAAFGAVDLVHAVTLAYRLPLASTREVEIRRERVTRMFIRRSRSLAAPRLPKLRSQESPRSLPSSDFEGRTCPTWAIGSWTAIAPRPSECDGRPFVKRLCPSESGEATRRQALSVVVGSRPFLSPARITTARDSHPMQWAVTSAFHRGTKLSSCIAAGLDHIPTDSFATTLPAYRWSLPICRPPPIVNDGEIVTLPAVSCSRSPARLLSR